MPAGIVTAARAASAQAGARMLAAGGNAADATVATAFALTVADPANCGIGGYGGYAVIDLGGTSRPLQVEFNTAAPAALEERMLEQVPRRDSFIYGGMSVSRPSVVAGLRHIHGRFGRMPWADVLAPAIELAGDGVLTGPDLARAFAWARRKPEAFRPDFWCCFAFEPDFEPEIVTETCRLRQPALCDTLKLIASEGASAFESGPLVDAMTQAVQQAKGVLRSEDLADHEVGECPATEFRFGDASIYGPRPETTGIGVLMAALGSAGHRQWPAVRDAAYIQRVAAALREAWKSRLAEARPLVASAQATQHTTHLCAADEDGTLVSLTFTHGPLWFGSALAVPGTGIILNCGVNLLVHEHRTGRRIARTNLTPVVAHADDGARHALGTPGGYRIPAAVMTALIDVLASDCPLSDALARPRIATNMQGDLEVEEELAAAARGARAMRSEEFYGPASGITLTPDGKMLGARDQRFHNAVAFVDPGGMISLTE
jgi:gamma-glutamyltranspeptidase / glutathione hydrolase